MSTLTRQRCWVHLEREAAARCPVCTRFYCRECVTEHDGKVVCAGCLRDLLAAAAQRKGLSARSRKFAASLVRGGQMVLSVLVAWMFFQLLGHWLLSTATQFHDTSMWKEQFFGGGSGDEDGDEINTDKNDPENRRFKNDDDASDNRTVKERKAAREKQDDNGG